MSTSRAAITGRRHFLSRTSAVGAAAMLGLNSPVRAEPPAETKRIRIMSDEAICFAPQLLASEMLRMEGFTEVEYVPMDYNRYPTDASALAAGKADIASDAAINFAPLIDAAQPVAILSGLHVGCWELFGGPRIKAVRDLKGKRVVVAATGAEEYLLTWSILAYLGMDPRKDVEFVTIPEYADQVKAFAAGSVDAIFGFPPQPQMLRAQKIGHVVIDSTRDRPWSQYFCCVVAANKEFTTRSPVATKRALRAILKVADVCAQDPQRAARDLVASGREKNYGVALEVLSKIPYGRWREDNPEDTLRFHALRLHEVGMIKSSPQKLIAQGTDWRFLNELRRELKA